MERHAMKGLFLGAVLAAAACHTHEVGRRDRAPEAEAQTKAEETAQSHEVHRDISSGRPVHSTPRGFLSRSAILQIQRALGEKGEHVQATGKLDGTTQAALRRFQKSQQQPTTGYPDFGTLDRLGLDASSLYGGRPDKETGAAGIVK